MNRDRMLEQLDDRTIEWDVVVIGGGATGLGVAVDSATRGLRTLLLEQVDFSEGTSSRSTKLIHGGVRYLRNGEIGLVRESLRERGRLLKNAPHLVHPLPFVVPAYRWYERFYYGAGMIVYDLLAGKLGIESIGHLSKKKVLERLPNLRDSGLRGGTLYWDGQFDDARLAIALAQTAAENGATVLNHVGVNELIEEGGKIRGVKAVDRITGKEYRAGAKVVINATGVFSDSIRQMDDADSGESIVPSQGIHIVLDGDFLGPDATTAIMIPKTDDGRVLFAIPWSSRVLVGTTDTPDVPAEIDPKPQEDEVDYLIEHAARYLTRAPTRSDIRATFAGLRPLVLPPDAEKKGATSKFSRTHSITVSKSGLVTIAGGKWTTYRQMAEDTLDRAIKAGHLKKTPCRTADLKLSAPPDMEAIQTENPDWMEKLSHDLPWRFADVVAAVRHEMAQTVLDVLARRTRILFLDEEAARKCGHQVVQVMAAELKRGEDWVAGQLKLLRESV